MGKLSRLSLLWPAIVLALLLGQSVGHAQEQRFALVIGNDQYKAGRLATPANDAGLVANALQAAGFTVTGARNLDQQTLRESFREFIGQVSAAGPDAVALVYLSGLGLQFEGENYFVPVDADLQRDVDVPLQAIRVSDFLQPLAAMPGRAKIVILDAARQNPFTIGGQPLASGLALIDPIGGMAVAYNAAPGTVGPQEQGPYGAYANSLTEMIATGGLSLDDIFARLRLRVSDLTQGAEIPWSVSQINGPFFMTELAPGAPPPPNVMPLADIRSKPLRDFPNVDDAYAAALDRDTIEAYEQFLAIYPDSPYSQRVAAMLAVRREEIVWRRCVLANTPPAYWSYLRRYPHGPHSWDARRRLAMLSAPFDPPPNFVLYDFGVPPPPPAELVFFDRPVFIFAGPGFAPPPRPPLFFLPPRPRAFGALPPPPPPSGRFGLPLPGPTVIPAFVRPPAAVVVRPATGGAAGPGGPGAPPGSRAPLSVSLPGAVQRVGPGGPPGGREERRALPGGAPIAAPPPPGASTPPSKPTPPTAFVKPSPLPAQPSGPAPATVKPGPPPPIHPGPVPATIKPATPPPAPTGPAPAVVKPAPAPPSPPPPAPRTPTTFKPAPLLPHPGPAPAVAKPGPPPPAPPPPHPPVPTAAKPPPPAAGPPPPKRPPPCPPGKTMTPQGCK
ncbi:MAG TPA: caspase family protein [Xanthobacteraceae bacterium]|nr:caspase family protein [Xanthobacteraceae bacterium]